LAAARFLNVWFRCSLTGGEARVNDDGSPAMGWFAPDALPPVDDWVKLRAGGRGGRWSRGGQPGRAVVPRWPGSREMGPPTCRKAHFLEDKSIMRV
jgi:hypothetical protein